MRLGLVNGWRPIARGLASLLASTLISASILISGCSRASAPIPVTQLEAGRFPHPVHRQLSCETCHSKADVLASRPAIAGKNDHAPCDQSGCHRKDFLGKPTPLCMICHQTVDILGEKTRLRPFPRQSGSIVLASKFSHKQHLDYGLMEQSVGFHVSCADCHLDQKTDSIRRNSYRTSHRSCTRCHAPEARLRHAPAMDECSGCHQPRQVKPKLERHLIIGDLRFNHDSHIEDRGGIVIRCIECHSQTPSSTTRTDQPSPVTRNCVGCHDDTARVPPTKRMRICETCHATRQAALGSIAPRSHLPASERPLDHTPAFRRDHGADAERDPARCARCHTVVSGSNRDVCDECHQVIRPTDHTITFIEFDHGQDAAVEASRCATCHSADYCVTCHRQVPRSHIPLTEYRSGGHAFAAEINIRSCITCHQQQTFCSQSGCHQRSQP